LSSAKVVHLDDIDAIPGPGTLTWRPVRATLGVRAFGCNAYTADEVGADVVEPHTESPQLGHQELYFVARGRARFTLDGEEHDAPAGTYVFVPDTATHRHAVAEEPGTTVLSFGGPAGFQPSAWEWTFRAVAEKRNDPQQAKEILNDGLATYPDSPSINYELACWEAVHGDTQKALDHLRRAIEAEPEVRKWLEDDEDLEPLREEPAFQELRSG
jgi:mannose-6-phosphate isomerase-like protein (cupin superfamily)